MYFPILSDAASAEQENVPPATASGEVSSERPQQSNPRCTLSNSSLTTSAPNILQPLTLNSSNGLLETIFPVDHTPSPTSPRGASELGNLGEPANCRRRLEQRPFSELYSEEFVPLDDVDVTSPELSRSSEVTNDENTLDADDTTDAENLGDNRTSNSLASSIDIEAPDESIDQEQDSQSALDNTDGSSSLDASATLTPGPEENSQDLENQPMEIPEESNEVNNSEVEMSLSGAGQRTSVESIELTEDSPLRILEESERVREERIALSRENLLQDPPAESDDELEQMDITEETITERDSSQISDSSMEDVLTSGNITETALDESISVETQPMAERETDLLEAASDGLLDEDVNDPTELEESRPSPPVLESLPGPSSLIEPETEALEMTAAEDNLPQPVENSENESSEQQAISTGDELMSLLEYVDQIFAGDTTEQSEDSAMIVESVENSAQVGTSSNGPGVGSSEVVGRSAGDSSNGAMPSVTLPAEASEPVCLDATSLQSASTSEMIVDTPSASFAVQNRVSDDNGASPQRPPRGKRLSRSSSDPRSTHSRRLAERSRNAVRGSIQGEDSARTSRPPLIRRVTEPPAVQTNVVDPAVVPVNTGVSSQVPNTMAVATSVTDAVADSEVFSPRESVVMAVPLSPPPQRISSSSSSTAVVVADVVPEAEAAAASVTPLPSPDSVSERTNSTFDDQPAAVAVSSEAVRRLTGGSPTSRVLPDDYELIVPSESTQPSSAPSTLRRGEASAVVQVQHRRNSSQDNSSSVIYATPVSGLSRELADQQSASFPRQSSTARVTALSGNRRRSSSSGSGYTVSRAVPEESQSLPRNYGHTVSNSPTGVLSASATLNSEQSRSNTATSHDASSAGPSGQSGSNLNQSRQEIQNMLRSYCIQSTQVPGRPPSATRPPRAPTTSAAEPETARRPSQPNNRNGNRRSSGRRLQGNPVHVSIQDPQQARGQQTQPGQQSPEEESLPPSKIRKIFKSYPKIPLYLSCSPLTAHESQIEKKGSFTGTALSFVYSEKNVGQKFSK